MPKYDYKCPSCGVFETFQKMSDPSLTSCPECGSEIKKVFTSPAMTGFERKPQPRLDMNKSALWNSAQVE